MYVKMHYHTCVVIYTKHKKKDNIMLRPYLSHVKKKLRKQEKETRVKIEEPAPKRRR